MDVSPHLRTGREKVDLNFSAMETNTTTQPTKEAAKPAAGAPATKPAERGGRGRGRGGNRPGGRGRRRNQQKAPREFEQKILDLSRVTRVTAGGKRMSFRCGLVIGDKKGRVGFGIAKGKDVQIAIEKAYKQAKKNLVTVPMVNETIPHEVKIKFGAARVLLKPAPKGTGLKSGGAVRMILEHAGLPNAVSKIINSNNKLNLAQATLEALRSLRKS